MDIVAMLQEGQTSGLYSEKSYNFSFRTGGNGVFYEVRADGYVTQP
jgi:hypothetical protein